MGAVASAEKTVKNPALAPETNEQRQAKLKKACADLESVFIGTLIKAMRQTVPKSGLTQPEAGADVYRSMSDQQLAVFLSKNQGLGLARQVYDQMSRRDKALASPSDSRSGDEAPQAAETPTRQTLPAGLSTTSPGRSPINEGN